MKGLIMKEPYGTLIYQERKKMFLRNKKTDLVGKRLLLIEDDYALGVIEPTDVLELNEDTYLDSVEMHKMELTVNEDTEFPIYGYKFKFSKFPHPKLIKEDITDKEILDGVSFVYTEESKDEKEQFMSELSTKTDLASLGSMAKFKFIKHDKPFKHTHAKIIQNGTIKYSWVIRDAPQEGAYYMVGKDGVCGMIFKSKTKPGYWNITTFKKQQSKSKTEMNKQEVIEMGYNEFISRLFPKQENMEISIGKNFYFFDKLETSIINAVEFCKSLNSETKFLMTWPDVEDTRESFVKSGFFVKSLKYGENLNESVLLVSNYELPIEQFAKWTRDYINRLPDSAFAYIESGGKKDAEGKTVPRSLRHLPIYDLQGNLDPDHVRNSLSRLPQTDISDAAKAEAKKKIVAAAKKLGIGEYNADADSTTSDNASFSISVGDLQDAGLQEVKGGEKQTEVTCECPVCKYEMNSDKSCDDIKCPMCGGTMQKSERNNGETYTRKNEEFTAENETFKIIENEDKPDKIIIKGMLFHPGKITGRHGTTVNLTKDLLKYAKLEVPEGQDDCYINYDHMPGKTNMAGKLIGVKWNPVRRWTCPKDGKLHYGALDFESEITDPDTISNILDKKVRRVSGEIRWDGTPDDPLQLYITGKALTNMPASPESIIDEYCDNKSCKAL